MKADTNNSKGDNPSQTKVGLLEKGATALGCFGGLFLVAFTFWGIGWTWYRHGVGHGLAATFVPPYAWYRGVAYTWEDPKWVDEWEEQTETIGAILIASPDQSQSLKLPKYMAKSRSWISSIPESERKDLHQKLNSFIRALVLHSKLLEEEIFLGTPPKKEALFIEELVAGFSDDAGLIRAWEKVLSGEQSVKYQMEKYYQGLSMAEREEARREILEGAYSANAWVSPMERAVKDLFSE